MPPVYIPRGSFLGYAALETDHGVMVVFDSCPPQNQGNRIYAPGTAGNEGEVTIGRVAVLRQETRTGGVTLSYFDSF